MLRRSTLRTDANVNRPWRRHWFEVLATPVTALFLQRRFLLVVPCDRHCTGEIRKWNLFGSNPPQQSRAARPQPATLRLHSLRRKPFQCVHQRYPMKWSFAPVVLLEGLGSG